jgi:hypothetical protein
MASRAGTSIMAIGLPLAAAARRAHDDDGVSSFNPIRYRRHDARVFLYAFDLIELNGDDPAA